MEREFWLERWRTGQIGWHQAGAHAFLEACGGMLWRTARAPRVFVPFCGASVDMLWLRRRGASVVGIDLSPEAFTRFCDDAGLEPVVDRTCLFQRWSADGIELLAGDFFDADASVLGPFDAVYDRAALVALPAPMRVRYAAHLTRLCRAGTRILLVTFDYDQCEMAGPPFAVPAQEVAALYGQAFGIERLAHADVLAANARMRERGVTSLHETAWLLDKLPETPGT